MSTALPATVLVSRTARDRDGAALNKWAHELCRDAAGFPGYLCSHVAAGGDSTVHIGLSFAGAEHLLRWERSETRASRLAEGEALTEGTPAPLPLTRGGGTGGAPSRLRSAILIWVALFPPAVLINAVVIPHLDAWPGIARTLLLTLVLVPTVVFGALPLLQNALGRWQRKRSKRPTG
ncbi:hypothetical protein BAY61_12510 [Prauserella marina]|uniref:Uncharacterized protein n=1 Tax=Prauserella marina TaxID=530584 RepID=A0A222VP37_9PSEU|nr:hypothetical protein [Prauserella marina]ASR35686.1 hypothetical protein BAY61_12510 [Prauserella marina]PWV84437.1 hypothetical protein DES30_101454 [Prauserella marina]SDC22581.1 hypothetical protein SAMN05421630_101883 [Prauserella marina]